MDVKGITWVGNIYQKFENMCLEVEEVMLEDTVKYIENQMQTVGESVKKIYSEVMQDLLPPSSHDLDEKVPSELPIEQHADNGSCEKTFQGFEEVTVKADTSETTEDSRVTHDVDNHEIHDESCDDEALFKSAFTDSSFENNSTSQADVESNLGDDENQQSMETPAFKTVSEITSIESDACSTSQSCEVSKENQNHVDTVSKPVSSAEVTRPAVEVLCCTEIEKESTEQSSNVLSLVKSADEKQIHMSYSSSSVIAGDTNGFSVSKTIQPDDCSHTTVAVSHPEITEGWNMDATMIDSIIDHNHKTMPQDHEPKLEESCVMVTSDGFQLVPKTCGNLQINKCLKKKRLQPFSLSKKSARKQEYEELAIWYEKNEKFKGDNVENLCPTSVKDQNKLLLSDISDAEWELL